MRAAPLQRLFLALAVLAVQAEACSISIAYNEVAAPPHYLGDGGKMPADPGVAVEVIDMAARSMGCRVQWQRMPIKRIFRDLEDGSIDATMALSFSQDRAQVYAYPMRDGQADEALAVWVASYDFYVKRGSDLSWNGKQFNRKPRGVGANAGFSVVQDLERMGITAEVAPADINNFGKLMTGRIEVFAGQSLTTAQLRNQAEYHQIRKLTPPFARKPYYLAFSKSFYAAAPDTVHTLWRKIAETKRLQGPALDDKYANR